jgi:hypothetical protein
MRIGGSVQPLPWLKSIENQHKARPSIMLPASPMKARAVLD